MAFIAQSTAITRSSVSGGPYRPLAPAWRSPQQYRKQQLSFTGVHDHQQQRQQHDEFFLKVQMPPHTAVSRSAAAAAAAAVSIRRQQQNARVIGASVIPMIMTACDRNQNMIVAAAGAAAGGGGGGGALAPPKPALAAADDHEGSGEQGRFGIVSARHCFSLLGTRERLYLHHIAAVNLSSNAGVICSSDHIVVESNMRSFNTLDVSCRTYKQHWLSLHFLSAAKVSHGLP